MNPKIEIMGILNLTPDSFSDGGEYYDGKQPSLALKRIATMIKEGASIIDIGGESTRPGAQKLSAAEELDRVLPVIKSAVKEFPQIKFSIDTFKPEVAAVALDAGVAIINDITGLQNIKMIELMQRYACEAVMMHMQGAPQTMQNNPTYKDVVQEVGDFFRLQLSKLQKLGIESSRIILDPGIGFGKSVEHNLQLIANLNSLKAIGPRLLIGASRKSFLGKILDLPNPKERLEASLAIALISYQQGVSIFRVHDVISTHQILKLAEQVNLHKII